MSKATPEAALGSVVIPGFAYNSLVAGDYLWFTYGGVAGGAMYCTTQNSEIEYKFTHRRGSYTLVLISYKSTDRGIATITIDGVQVGTIDLYAATATDNVFDTLPVTFGADGIHTLRVTNPTKNASSTGYRIYIRAICFRG
jgi:hypothetical protein